MGTFKTASEVTNGGFLSKIQDFGRIPLKIVKSVKFPEILATKLMSKPPV